MKPQRNGFSFLEMIVVLVIMSILLVIAIPAYRSIVFKNGRVEARSALTTMAIKQERLRSNCPLYAGRLGTIDFCGDSNGATMIAFKPTTESNRYALSVTADDTGYSILATAVGPQTEDVDCRTISLVLLRGTQTRSPSQCW
jgi:type IV pilus assembly protein PilE